MDTARLIGLDWGTSSLRAYLFDADGRILDRREAGAGILQVGDGRFREAFASTCAPWLERAPQLPAIASGMIGSRQGWREAPYVETPAGFDELSAGLLRIDAEAGRAFRIVPGVSTVLGSGAHDVMRGEETQIFGALGTARPAHGQPPGPAAARAVLVLPGTHSKWACVRGGRIERFRTYMTGEMYSVMSRHSILGRLFPAAGSSEGEHRFATHAFADGLDRAHADPGGLASLLFSVRAEGLFGRYAADALPSYLSGVLIGAELAHGLREASGRDRPPEETPLIVVGSEELTRRYLFALERFGVRARAAAPDVAAAGLFAIALRAGLVDGRCGAAPPAHPLPEGVR